MNDENIRPASEDPMGDPADQQGMGDDIRPASEDPYGDPADQATAGDIQDAVSQHLANTDPSYTQQLRQHNELNRRVFQRVATEALAGRGVAIGFTDNYRMSDGGEPICALKSYVLSPFANEEQMHAVVEHVLAACRAEQSGAGL